MLIVRACMGIFRTKVPWSRREKRCMGLRLMRLQPIPVIRTAPPRPTWKVALVAVLVPAVKPRLWAVACVKKHSCTSESESAAAHVYLAKA